MAGGMSLLGFFVTAAMHAFNILFSHSWRIVYVITLTCCLHRYPYLLSCAFRYSSPVVSFTLVRCVFRYSSPVVYIVTLTCCVSRYSSPVVFIVQQSLHVAEGNDNGQQHHRWSSVGRQPRWDGHQEPHDRRQLPPQVLRVQLLLTRSAAQGLLSRPCLWFCFCLNNFHLYSCVVWHL